MSKITTIEEWHRVRMSDGLSLFGFFTGPPDPMVGVGGSATVTSIIVEEGEDYVVTRSGTRYELGSHSAMADDS